MNLVHPESSAIGAPELPVGPVIASHLRELVMLHQRFAGSLKVVHLADRPVVPQMVVAPVVGHLLVVAPVVDHQLVGSLAPVPAGKPVLAEPWHDRVHREFLPILDLPFALLKGHPGVSWATADPRGFARLIAGYLIAGYLIAGYLIAGYLIVGYLIVGTLGRLTLVRFVHCSAGCLLDLSAGCSNLPGLAASLPADFRVVPRPD